MTSLQKGHFFGRHFDPSFLMQLQQKTLDSQLDSAAGGFGHGALPMRIPKTRQATSAGKTQ
jgi:hypothetical protein